jgi:hypothetical protein
MSKVRTLSLLCQDGRGPDPSGLKTRRHTTSRTSSSSLSVPHSYDHFSQPSYSSRSCAPTRRSDATRPSCGSRLRSIPAGAPEASVTLLLVTVTPRATCSRVVRGCRTATSACRRRNVSSHVHGFGGRIPEGYDLARRDWELPAVLRMWKKTRWRSSNG